MAFRFRKSVKIAPGVKVNFNKKSTSVSFGGKGARYTTKLGNNSDDKIPFTIKISIFLIFIGIVALFSRDSNAIPFLVIGVGLIGIWYLVAKIIYPKLATAAQKTTENIIGAMQGKTDDNNEASEQEE